MLGLILIILIFMYIKKYYKWTEKLGYFKSMGITALVLFTVVGIAMIIEGMKKVKKYNSM